VHFGSSALEQASIGSLALNRALESRSGRLVRSLKTILGTDLIDESTVIKGGLLKFRDILSLYLCHVKQRAEESLGIEVDSVVVGRPVFFVDRDEASDRAAERVLIEILQEVGFKNVQTIYEPVAAALHFGESLDRESLIFVADIGGGTADFSIVKIGPDKLGTNRSIEEVLSNVGVRVAGEVIDQKLALSSMMESFGYTKRLMNGKAMPNWLYYDLSHWARLNKCYSPRVRTVLNTLTNTGDNQAFLVRLKRLLKEESGHRLLTTVEDTKKALSVSDYYQTDVEFVEPAFSYEVTQEQFRISIDAELQALSSLGYRCLDMAGIDGRDVDKVVFTGGTTSIPILREKLMEVFPYSEACEVDLFGAVSLGCASYANMLYGSSPPMRKH
jgi:hypothetical chaperone protein